MGDFRNPSREFGPVPFWWWVGEPLVRERLAWQLDQLRAKGVRNAIVSYSHKGDGSNEPGDPPVFSPEWWDLLRWALDRCEERGMQLGFQDYTLLNPLLQEIGRGCGDMSGAGTLEETSERLPGGGALSLGIPEGRSPVSARAFPFVKGKLDPERAVAIAVSPETGRFEWQAPEGGDWLASVVWLKPSAFDPLHSESGARVIERYYARFERELGRHLGTTFPISFQDELDFGARMPFWSACLPALFKARKGYPPGAWLHALWHDLGTFSPKFRMDFADVVVGRLEDAYFRPVFEWHERRGLLFGHDNCGRGAIADGRRAYGDAFRTMRWFSAPGTDDPNLSHARAFKGLKVNSSIAHLNRRPRVWNEAFHSSGWGTTPASVIAALNVDFALGATVVNLHGLYYTTFGGWWEWAPPDFHFRQPYWEHSDALSGYCARLCQTLSAGVHACDVAILYPISALEGGLNPRVRETGADPTAYEVWRKDGPLLDAAEAAAFGIGRVLFRNGVDFDFIDDESLQSADFGGGNISVSGERYRVLVLPEMTSIRDATLRAILRFAAAGGKVIAHGALPVASDRAGAGDPLLDEAVRRLTAHLAARTGGGADEFGDVLEAVIACAGRDFDPDGTGACALHRSVEGRELYFVVNPGTAPISGRFGFRASGRCERWDPWTGEVHPQPAVRAGGMTRVEWELGPGDAALIVIFPGAGEAGARPADANAGGLPRCLRLEGEWDIELVPTLDNRHGDFRRPPAERFIGAEARRFRHRREGAIAANGWELEKLDDASWETVTYSHGPRFLCLGPVPPGVDCDDLEARLAGFERIDESAPVDVGGRILRWFPVGFSTRWGIENDPHLRDRSSGPHGLKGEVPDEFIDLHCDTPGAVWLLWTRLRVRADGERRLVAGSRSRMRVWLNGERKLEQAVELPPGRQSIWNLPHYRSERLEAPVRVTAGANTLLVRLTQPAGQRTRAYAAFASALTDAGGDLALRWFLDPDQPVFDPRPEISGASWFRSRTPPGAAAFTVTSRGRCRAWIGGSEAAVLWKGEVAPGVLESRFAAPMALPRESLLVLRVEGAPGSHGADCLPEPVRFECGAGRMEEGDWCRSGLQTYSGIVVYRRELEWSGADGGVILDLGDVRASAEVRVNGREAGRRLSPPWTYRLDGMLRTGANQLEVRVANTLANHYSIGIPSPFAWDDQTVSGLLGPVTLRIPEILHGQG